MRHARTPSRARSELHAGWLTVTGAFLVLLVGFGALYSQAAFAEPIAAEFGMPRGAVAATFALSGGSCFLVSALAGPLADRVGARVPTAAGMLMVGLGLAVAAAARTPVELLVGYGLLTGLGTGFAYVPVMAAVQRCFTASRGLASGLAASGIGVGTALVPPLSDALSGLGDWRAVFRVCAGLAAIVGLAGSLILHDAPAPRRPASATEPRPPRGFVLAYLGTLLVSLSASLPHALLVVTARDLGLPAQDAVALLGLIGLGTVPGRFLLASLADLVGRRSVFLACCAGMPAGMLVWASAVSTPALQAFALGFGVVQGGFVALLPAFIADSFGTQALGRRIGLLYTSRGIALLAAPPALALGMAAAGRPALPLAMTAALGLLGTALLAAVRR